MALQNSICEKKAEFPDCIIIRHAREGGHPEGLNLE